MRRLLVTLAWLCAPLAAALPLVSADLPPPTPPPPAPAPTSPTSSPDPKLDLPPIVPVATPTQVVLQAPLTMTHERYAWRQVAGAPVAWPSEPGATIRIDLPPPGSYAWEVCGGDGRSATPPVQVRLVVLADAAAGRWAIGYPERLTLRSGDRFAVDLRGVTAMPALPDDSVVTPPGATPPTAVPNPHTAIDWSRAWSVRWTGLRQSAEESAEAAAQRLQAWTYEDPLGPRVRVFQIPAELESGAYTLTFELLLDAGQPTARMLHTGAIRLEIARPAGTGLRPGSGAVTAVHNQPVGEALAAAQIGPGAPVIALPYGERTLSLRLQEALDLDGRLCSDPDADPLTYRWWHTRAPWSDERQRAAGTASFTVLEHPALWRWQPSKEADLGLHEFVLSVSDGKHLVYSRPVKVKVEPAAAATAAQLRVQAGAQAVVEVGRETRLDVAVEQFENGAWLPRFSGLEPRWAQKTRPPGILRVDPNDPLSAFQPYFRAETPGLYELEFSVAAGENISNTIAVRVQVLAANRPPVWLFEETPTVSGGVADTLELELPARDPDGDPLQFELRRLEGPPNAVGSPQAAVTGNPDAAADGLATVRLQLPPTAPGMYVIGAAVSDGKAFSATRPVLAWVREPAAFGLFLIQGPEQARVGETADYRLVGQGAAAQFIRWRATGAATRQAGAREGVSTRLSFDQPGTVELRALVADGLGQATWVTLAVQVGAAAQP